MKKLVLLLAFVQVFACSANSPSQQSGQNPQGHPVANEKPGVGDILILGDSLAVGIGAGSQGMRPMRCLSTLPHHKITTLATAGLKTDQLLSQINAEEVGQPHLIFVSIGGNDAISDFYHPGAYPKGKTLNEARQVFDKLLASKSVVVYLGLNPPLPGADRLRDVSALAASKNILVVDGMKGLWTRKDLMYDDFHPNSRGYEIMCDRLLKAINAYYP